MVDFIIGRQQIFDQKLNIYAYELLFRGQDFDLKHKDDATQATNQVITDCILELGLNNIVGPHKAFINFTTQNILEKTALRLPKDRIAIEVLENVEIDSQIINNLKELSQLGYTIALDDFVFSDEWEALIEFADIIKLDILEMGETKTRGLIKLLKPYNVKLLAEKVETLDEFHYLRELGCDYFQGYFFNKPNIVAGKRIGINQSAAIRLLTIVNNPNVEFEDLSKIISQDVGLSYKLLHYINSAFFALPNRIESIKHAISYLGLKEIKRWTNILTLASLSNKSEAVLQNALIRGKMCEQLASLIGDRPDHFFLIGILSSLDSFLDISLEDALKQLPLASDISLAILNKEGLAGEALECVINYEHWDILAMTFKDLDQKSIGEAYVKSIKWAKDVLSNLN
jgi:EAL and modified HD-GYP domain-containing signal transduction protein